MREATIARNYAEALLALADKANDRAGWGRLIADVADSMRREERLRHFLASPRVSNDEKNRVLGQAFQDRMPRLFVRFLQRLVSNRRQMLIPHVAVEYQGLLDALENRVHANVTVAREPSDGETQTIARELSRAVGKQVVPHVTVNSAILGGVVVRMGDTVMDGSVRHRLSVLRSRMAGQRR
ncbi:MAG TPA: ATP synthase F1 subunit delta [Gemmatimonadaceae bacterium]|nr:ATP synthase F1 subunit delta [Gemmatimonadaceae bacterium]